MSVFVDTIKNLIRSRQATGKLEWESLFNLLRSALKMRPSLWPKIPELFKELGLDELLAKAKAELTPKEIIKPVFTEKYEREKALGIGKAQERWKELLGEPPKEVIARPEEIEKGFEKTKELAADVLLFMPTGRLGKAASRIVAESPLLKTYLESKKLRGLIAQEFPKIAAKGIEPQIVATKPATTRMLQFTGFPKLTRAFQEFIRAMPEEKLAKANDLKALQTVRMAMNLAKKEGTTIAAQLESAWQNTLRLAPKLKERLIEQSATGLAKSRIAQEGGKLEDILPAMRQIVEKTAQEPVSEAIRLAGTKFPDFAKAEPFLAKYITNWQESPAKKSLESAGFLKAPITLGEKAKIGLAQLLSLTQTKKLETRFPELFRRLKYGTETAGAIGEQVGEELGRALNQLIKDPELAPKVAQALRGELKYGMTSEIKAIIESLPAQKATQIFNKLGDILAKTGLLAEKTVVARGGKYLPIAYRWGGKAGKEAKALLKEVVPERPLFGRTDVERLAQIRKLEPEIRETISKFEDPGLAIARGIPQEMRLAKLGTIMQDIAENPRYAQLISDELKAGFKLLPDKPAIYGKLAGKAVDSKLHSLLEDIVGGGGKTIKFYTPIHKAWKRSKTIWEFPTFYIRNLIAGIIQTNVLGGVPLWKIPVIGARGLKELVPRWLGKEATGLLKEAEQIGLTGRTFEAGEIGGKFGRVLAPGQEAKGLLTGAEPIAQVRKAIDWAKGAFGKDFLDKANEARLWIAQKPAQAAQATEQFMRYSFYKYLRGQGKSPGVAKEIVEYAHIDYKDVDKLTKFLRAVPGGLPFFTFMRYMVERFAKAAVGIHPLAKEIGMTAGTINVLGHKITFAPKVAARMAAYLGVPIITEEVIRQKLKVTKEQLQEAKPGWLETPIPGLVILIGKTQEGALKFLDFRYQLPYFEAIEAVTPFKAEPGKKIAFPPSLKELPFFARPGGPAAILYQMAANENWFTGKKIADPALPGSLQRKKRMEFFYQSMLPSWMPTVPGVSAGGYRFKKFVEAYYQIPSISGKVKKLPETLMDVLGTIKIRESDSSEVRRWKALEQRDILKDFQKARTRLEREYEAVEQSKLPEATKRRLRQERDRLLRELSKMEAEVMRR